MNMENIAIDLIKRKILGEIKRDTNGAVVEVMSEMNQGEPFFSYGVTVVKIKEVAKEHRPNHPLAIDLFNSKIRELKLAAIYIDNADEVTEEQMRLWSSSYDSLEIVEHSCTMLFYAAKDALKIALEWSVVKDRFMAKAAYLIGAKRAKMMYAEQEIESYMTLYNNAIKDIQEKENRHTVQAAEKFVVALANKNNEIKNRLLNLIETCDIGNSKGEIEWQI